MGRTASYVYTEWIWFESWPGITCYGWHLFVVSLFMRCLTTLKQVLKLLHYLALNEKRPNIFLYSKHIWCICIRKINIFYLWKWQNAVKCSRLIGHVNMDLKSSVSGMSDIYIDNGDIQGWSPEKYLLGRYFYSILYCFSRTVYILHCTFARLLF